MKNIPAQVQENFKEGRRTSFLTRYKTREQSNNRSNKCNENKKKRNKVGGSSVASRAHRTSMHIVKLDRGFSCPVVPRAYFPIAPRLENVPTHINASHRLVNDTNWNKCYRKTPRHTNDATARRRHYTTSSTRLYPPPLPQKRRLTVQTQFIFISS